MENVDPNAVEDHDGILTIRGGGTRRIGAKLVVTPIKRDGRCTMITLDPDTRQRSPRHC